MSIVNDLQNEDNTYGIVAHTLEECLLIDIAGHYGSLPVKINVHPTKMNTFWINLQDEEHILFSFFFDFSVSPCGTNDGRRLHTLDNRTKYSLIRDTVLMELQKFTEDSEDDD